MKKVREFTIKYWRTIIGTVLVVGVMAGLLGFSLQSLTGSFSEGELKFIDSSATFDGIKQNPTFLPLKLPLFALQSLGDITPLTARAISTMYGALTVIVFFFLIRTWYSPRIAVLGSILLLTSSWFLHISRIALPMVLFMFGTMMLLGFSYAYFKKRRSRIRGTALLVTIILSIYIPGMQLVLLAFVLAALRPTLIALQKLSTIQKVTTCMVLVVTAIPMVLAYINNPGLILPSFGLPDVFLPLEWLKRLFVVPIFLFAQGPFEPQYNLGRLPLLDIFSSAMVLLGLYAYYFQLHLTRTRMFIAGLGATVVLVTFGGPPYLAYLLPVIYILVTAGVALLLQQWFTVFPKNPLVRSLGVMIIITAIALTSFYHIQRYFVAWAGNPNTRNTFIYSHQE